MSVSTFCFSFLIFSSSILFSLFCDDFCVFLPLGCLPYFMLRTYFLPKSQKSQTFFSPRHVLEIVFFSKVHNDTLEGKHSCDVPLIHAFTTFLKWFHWYAKIIIIKTRLHIQFTDEFSALRCVFPVLTLACSTKASI